MNTNMTGFRWFSTLVRIFSGMNELNGALTRLTFMVSTGCHSAIIFLGVIYRNLCNVNAELILPNLPNGFKTVRFKTVT